MTRHPQFNGHRPRRGAACVLGAAALLLGVAGCGTFWDEALSNERDWAYAFGRRPDPLKVLSESRDGVRRQQALVDIKEPLRNGGNANDQKAVLDILEASAKNDREPTCRLAAIGNLGKWKDPRAARILEDVYQQPKLPFTKDIDCMIRQHALRALEQCHDPDSRHLLVRVARQPGPPREASLTDRQQTQDEKLIAIRALKQYKQPECLDALKYILREEKDVALRDIALASLETATNKKWPAAREVWQADNVQPIGVKEESYIQRVGAWFTR